MKTGYNNCANRGGVYRIVNTTNGRVYYGSAKEFKDRKRSHLTRLRNDRHGNKFLQNDFNKCGSDAFIFEVIEVVDNIKADRWNREQYYLNLHYDDQQQCYNFQKIAHKGNRTKFSNTPTETKKLLSEKSKANWADPKMRKKILKRKNAAQQTDEYRQNCSKAQKKNWKKDPDRRKKMSARVKEMHQQPGYTEQAIKKTIANRDEEVTRNTKIKNKLLFLTERKEAVMEKQDWLGPDVSRSKIYEEANLISPNGILFKKIRNLNAFAKEHDVKDSWKLQEVVELKRWQYKGWVKLLDIENAENFKSPKELLEYCRKKEYNRSRKVKPKAKVYGSLVDPNGKVYKNITNVPTFAKRHGLIKTSLYDVLNGKRKSHRGWKIKCQQTKRVQRF